MQFCLGFRGSVATVWIVSLQLGAEDMLVSSECFREAVEDTPPANLHDRNLNHGKCRAKSGATAAIASTVRRYDKSIAMDASSRSCRTAANRCASSPPCTCADSACDHHWDCTSWDCTRTRIQFFSKSNPLRIGMRMHAQMSNDAGPDDCEHSRCRRGCGEASAVDALCFAAGP